MKKWLIGVDEVGRGPLAGPVGVGVALVPDKFDWSLLAGVTDSKKLTEKKRAVILEQAKKLRNEGKLDFAVMMVSASVIDKKGIVFAINLAMGRALQKIEKNLYKQVNSTKTTPQQENPRATTPINWSSGGGDFYKKQLTVKLDGGLRAPERFLQQETIIKGDAKEKVIGLASVVAKETRDDYMRQQAKLAAYVPYDFAKHKGYATKAHRTAIAKSGLSAIHRQSFCKNIKSMS